jgi:hypothetical protein
VYARKKLPETPRFTAHVQGNAAKAAADLKTVTGVDEKEQVMS